MPRRRLAALPVLALAAAALAAPPAQAKEIQRVSACGADGCVEVTARAHDEALLEVGAAAGGPTADGPGFVRLTVTVGDASGAYARIAQLYVPARNLAASRMDSGGWQWWTPDATARAQLRRAVRGVHPLPASRLPRAAVRTALATPAPRRPAVSHAGAGGGGMPAWGWVALAAALAAVAAGCGRAALRSPRRRR